MCVPGAPTVQKSLDPELELQIVVCHYVDAEEQTQTLHKNNKYSQTPRHLSINLYCF